MVFRSLLLSLAALRIALVTVAFLPRPFLIARKELAASFLRCGRLDGTKPIVVNFPPDLNDVVES